MNDLSDLERLLVVATQENSLPTVQDLGEATVVAEQLPAVAATPSAPLAAGVLVRAISADSTGSGWLAVVRDFARSLGGQSQVLALMESLDILLDVTWGASIVGGDLHQVMLAGIDDALGDDPHLASVRLEGALRVALSGRERPYQVLDRLTEDVSTHPEDYRARLPVLLGVALDRWPASTDIGAPLLDALRRLVDDEASDADAAFEIAMNHLRTSLGVEDIATAVEGLDRTAAFFEEAIELDEMRDDAAVYRSACRAVSAFVKDDLDGFTSSSSALQASFASRARWQYNTHLPRWRRPAADAEAAWFRLITDLSATRLRLDEPSWLNAEAAIGQLLLVYRAERSIAPTGAVNALLEPVIVNRVAQSAVLRDQLERAVTADRNRPQPVLPLVADDLLTAVRAYRHARGPSPTARGSSGDDHAASTDDDDDWERVSADRVARIAPGLTLLGRLVCGALGNLNDDALRTAGGLVDSLASTGRREHPELSQIRARIERELQESPRFIGVEAAAVSSMLKHTLTFLLDRYDRGGPIQPGAKNIIRPVAPGKKRPVERDLQQEFYIWTASLWELAGYVKCEMSDVSTGRVDVTVRISEIEIVTEFKRELTDPSRECLESKYVGQAAQYSGTSTPFSQLLVLDLTDHSAGVPPLDDLVWVARHRAPSAQTVQFVVAGVVVGNRPAPSNIKTNHENLNR